MPRATFGIPCTVVAIETAPQTKLDRMRALGAKIVPCPTTTPGRRPRAHEFAGMEGTFIHPFDNHDFIAGHATMGLEILEDRAGRAHRHLRHRRRRADQRRRQRDQGAEARDQGPRRRARDRRALRLSLARAGRASSPTGRPRSSTAPAARACPSGCGSGCGRSLDGDDHRHAGPDPRGDAADRREDADDRRRRGRAVPRRRADRKAGTGRSSHRLGRQHRPREIRRAGRKLIEVRCSLWVESRHSGKPLSPQWQPASAFFEPGIVVGNGVVGDLATRCFMAVRAVNGEESVCGGFRGFRDHLWIWAIDRAEQPLLEHVPLVETLPVHRRYPRVGAP